MSTKNSKLILLLLLAAPAAYADDLGAFNQQILPAPTPTPVQKYVAERSPVPSSVNRYLGLNLTVGLGTLKYSINVRPIDDTIDTEGNNNFFDYGGGIFGGLGTNFDHFYFGVEALGGLDFVNKDLGNLADNQTILNVQRDFTGGFDLLPGYISTDKTTLLYGRFGAAISSFTCKLNALPDDPFLSTTKNFSTTESGWRAGLGIEYFSEEFLSFRLEYVYSQFNKISNSMLGKDGNTYSHDLTPTFHQVNLGVNFHF